MKALHTELREGPGIVTRAYTISEVPGTGMNVPIKPSDVPGTGKTQVNARPRRRSLIEVDDSIELEWHAPSLGERPRGSSSWF